MTSHFEKYNEGKHDFAKQAQKTDDLVKALEYFKRQAHSWRGYTEEKLYRAAIEVIESHGTQPPQDGGWLSMESAPKIGMLLVTNGRGTWPARWMGGKEGDGYYELDSPYTRINRCTFWLPIPLPPQPAKTEGGVL